MSELYYRLVPGTLNQKQSIFVKDSVNLFEHVRKAKLKNIGYVSVFKYRPEQVEQYNTKGTIKGITDVVGSKLYWDIDCANDLPKARESALELIDNLRKYNIPEDSIEVVFSGNKGFHVYVHTSNELSRSEVEKIAYFFGNSLTGFDTTMYDAPQVIRFPTSVHKDSGLYCTQLTVQDLRENGIQEIQNLARELVDTLEYKTYDFKANFKEQLPDIIEKTRVVDMDFTLPKKIDDIDFNKKPMFLTPEKYVLAQGFFPEGKRHEVYMILAATYRGANFDRSETYRMLKAVDEKQRAITGQDPFPHDEIWGNILPSVFSPTWNGGTYGLEHPILRQIHDQLPKHVMMQEDSKYQCFTPASLFDKFKKFAMDIDKNTITWGLPELDAKLRFLKGHLVGLLAPPSVGKSSMMLRVARENSKAGRNVLILSLDMGEVPVMEFFSKAAAQISTERIYEGLKNGDENMETKIREQLNTEFDRVRLCTMPSMSVDEIRRVIEVQERIIGAEIDIIIVDYLELVCTKSLEPTQASAEAIQGLREIAHKGKAVLCLMQPNKTNAKPGEPILNYSGAKGSSSIGQAVAAMLTMHRPGWGSRSPQDDKWIGFDCVKNRHGQLFHEYFSWEGLTGNIRSMTALEKTMLQNFIDRKAAEQEDEEKEYKKY
jgi:DnaB-like helicase C terminal domain